MVDGSRARTSEAVRCIDVDPLTDPGWAQLTGDPAADVFHSAQWLGLLANTYGFEPRALLLVDGENEPLGGLPYCLMDGIPAKRIATPPFSDFCDPIVADVASWDLILDALLAEGCRVTVRCLHNELPLVGTRLQPVARAKWHGLDLAPDVDDIWSSLHSSARRAVRKGRAGGVTVREAVDKSDLRAFYELHLGIRKYKYRLLAQPYKFFEEIWDAFVSTGMGRLLLADVEGTVVAGVMFLEWGNTLYYKFNASDSESISLRPNDSIIWSAIEAAKQRDLAVLDFGLSDWDQDGLVRYKRKYSSEEKTITFLRNKEETPSPTAAAAGRLLPALTELLTNDAVPDEITERAGELLYPFFA